MAIQSAKKRGWSTGAMCAFLTLLYLAGGTVVHHAEINIYGSPVYYASAALHAMAALGSVLASDALLAIFLVVCPFLGALEVAFGINHLTVIIEKLSSDVWIVQRCNIGGCAYGEISMAGLALTVGLYVLMKVLLWSAVNSRMSTVFASKQKGSITPPFKEGETDKQVEGETLV